MHARPTRIRLPSVDLPLRPAGLRPEPGLAEPLARLEGVDGGGFLKRQPDIVEPVDQAVLLERVDIEVADANGQRVAVRGKLKPGDRVAVRGAEGLDDGELVAVHSET